MHVVDPHSLCHAKKKDVQLKAMNRPCWHWAALPKAPRRLRCFSETKLWIASSLNYFYNSVHSLYSAERRSFLFRSRSTGINGSDQYGEEVLCEEGRGLVLIG